MKITKNEYHKIGEENKIKGTTTATDKNRKKIRNKTC